MSEVTREQMEDVRQRLPRLLQALDSIAERTLQAKRLLLIAGIILVIGLGTGAIGIFNARTAASSAAQTKKNLAQTEVLVTLITDCLDEKAASGGECAKRNARNQSLILQIIGEQVEVRRNKTETRIAKACAPTDVDCRTRERETIQAEEQAKIDDLNQQIIANRQQQ